MKNIISILTVVTLSFGHVSAQSGEFEGPLNVRNGALSLFNSGGSQNLLFTDGEGDLIVTAGKNLEYKSNGDLIKHSGGDFQMNSPNDLVHYAFNMTNDGIMNLTMTSGITALSYNENIRRLGINSLIPTTDLHVLQDKTPALNGPNALVSNLSGFTIENTQGDESTFFVHTDKDLTLCFDGIYRGFWNDQTGAYLAVSDVRLKEKIAPISNILSKVLKLRPVSYQFKGYENPDRAMGFIAQEVEEVFPELVSEKDGMKGLTYDEFAVLAIRAVQEQQELIAGQQRVIEKLERRVSALEK